MSQGKNHDEPIAATGFRVRLTTHEPLTGARIRSEPAERLGREGLVTVWDEHGRIVGCMGVELWLHLLSVEGMRKALTYYAEGRIWDSGEIAREALRDA